eukprot:Hpha_TRINITY_DN16726_c0_g2::TRINITY_DN16726_c0_g2_i3::g.80494::m.80494
MNPALPPLSSTPHQPLVPPSPSSGPVTTAPTPTVATPPSGTNSSLSATLRPQPFAGLESPAPRSIQTQPAQVTPGSAPLPPPPGLPPPIPRSSGLSRLPPPAQPLQAPSDLVTPPSPGLMHQTSPALRPGLGTPSMTPQSAPISDLDEVSLPAPASENAAANGPVPPCGHNVWDNVRAKKDCVTLCCRECRARWKPCSRTLRRCAEFQTAAGCPRGAECPLTHVFKFKQPTKARRRLESAAGSEVVSPAAQPLPTSPPVEPSSGVPTQRTPVPADARTPADARITADVRLPADARLPAAVSPAMQPQKTQPDARLAAKPGGSAAAGFPGPAGRPAVY